MKQDFMFKHKSGSPTVLDGGKDDRDDTTVVIGKFGDDMRRMDVEGKGGGERNQDGEKGNVEETRNMLGGDQTDDDLSIVGEGDEVDIEEAQLEDVRAQQRGPVRKRTWTGER